MRAPVPSRRRSRPPVDLVIVLVALVTALGAGVAGAQERVEGTWELEDPGRSDDRVHLSLRIDRGDGQWRSGFGIERAELSGLPVDPADTGDLAFELVREAGTVRFEGGFHGRGRPGGARGTGLFTFTPSPEYRERLADLGHPSLSAERLLLFAVQDVTIGYVEGLRALGYERLSDDDLVRFVIHGVSLEYIRALAELGYDRVEPEQLVRLRIHDVTPEYVRDVRRALSGS